jgi:hypothetical protein
MDDLGRSLAVGLAGRVDLVLGTPTPHAEQSFCAWLPGGVLPTDYRTAARVADVIVLCLSVPEGRALLPKLPLNASQIVVMPLAADEVQAAGLAAGILAQVLAVSFENGARLTPEFILACIHASDKH